MFGVKKIEKVVANELYAAQRDALDAAGVVEQAQHALDVAAARLTMLNNRVMRLAMHGDADIGPFGGTTLTPVNTLGASGNWRCGGSTETPADGRLGGASHG